MDRFQPKSDKRAAMTEVVSYHGKVPLERGLCYCLYLVGEHFDCAVEMTSALISAARDERYIVEHNREFRTNLHSQSWLIKMHEVNPKAYAPANPVDETSHCLRSDGSTCYQDYRRQQIPPGGKLNWYQRGLDFRSNDLAVRFVHLAAQLKLDFVLPYHSGAELHHAVGVASPVRVLQSRNIIAKR